MTQNSDAFGLGQGRVNPITLEHVWNFNKKDGLRIFLPDQITIQDKIRIASLLPTKRVIPIEGERRLHRKKG